MADSFTLLSDGAGAADLTAGLATKQNLFTTTAVKTGTYTAAMGELVRCDASSGSFTVTLPAASSAGQVAVKLLTTSGTNTVTVARAGSDTINNAATSITLTLTDEAAVLTSNSSGVWTVAEGRASLTSLDGRFGRADDPPLVSNMWTILSGRPYAMSVTTSSLAKDIWRFVPCRTGAAIPIKALTVETTVAATGGTAALIFAIYSVGTDGRPSAVVTDLSGAGSVDLTATAGVQTRTGISASIPAGECFIGCAWTGTATGAPTLRVLATSHPRILDAAAGVTARNAYLLGSSGGSAPSPVTVSTTATSGPIIFGQLQ